MEKIRNTHNVASPVKKCITKTGRYQLLIFLLLIAIVGFWALTRANDLSVIDTQARDTVDRELQATIAQQVDAERQLTRDARARKADVMFAAAIESQQVERRMQELATQLKSHYQTEEGLPYLFKFDPYVFSRLTQDIIDHGYPGSTLHDGVPWDLLRLPPSGRPATYSLLPYFQAGVYKVISPVTGWSLHHVLFLLPVWVGIGSLFLLFFIIRLVTSRSFPALVAALLLAVHPVFFNFNGAGYPDTNYLNLFLSLLAIFFFLLALKSTGTGRWIYGGSVVVVLYVFMLVWTGWYYVPIIFLLFALAGSALYLLRRARRGNRNAWLALAGLTFSSVFFVFIASLTTQATDILARLNIVSARVGFYPYPSTIIRELQSLSLPELNDFLGGIVFVLFALVPLMMLAYRFLKKEKIELTLLFVAIWAVPLIIAGFLSVRFIFYAIPPFLVLVALGADHLATLGRKVLSKRSNTPAMGLISIGVVSLILFSNVLGILLVEPETLPIMNDAVAETASYITANSNEYTIINTWWDMGYIWQAAAQRPTALDGGGINKPRLWWLARALGTHDEREAVRLFRFIDCGGDTALLTHAQEKYGDREGHDMMLQLTNSSAEEARLLLRTHELPADFIQSTHCTPDALLVVSEDMVLKLSSIESISNVDFDTGSLPDASVKAGSEFMSCVNNAGIVRCANGDTVNLSSLETRSAQDLTVRVDVYESTGRRVRHFGTADSPLALILVEEKEQFRGFYVHESFADTVLVRAFGGDPTLEFLEQEHTTSGHVRIVTYRMLWDSENQDEQNMSTTRDTTRS